MSITFIGAGPGAADLITLRGAKILSTAQVVLHDALIDPALLDHAPASALRIDVGKRCRDKTLAHSSVQANINLALVEYGRQYERVVRLKGGDPALFGRLDEEIQAVTSAGLDFSIVPGVSSAQAAAACAQTALTRRGITRSVRLLTPSVGVDQPDNPWQKSLTPNETLVFYMGGSQMVGIAQTLLRQDFAQDTPVIVVYGASWNNEKIIRTTLMELATCPPLNDEGSPCIILVGQALIDHPALG